MMGASEMGDRDGGWRTSETGAGGRRTARRREPGFTLIELLVVIGIIATLAGLVLPVLAAGRESARAVACASGVRQLGASLLVYAGDNKSLAPAGAPNFLTNRTRWFGSRGGGTGSFSAEGGTLSAYLDGAGGLRACPGFAKRLEELASRTAAGGGFERGCGGYGYNNAYVGVQRGADDSLITDRTGERVERFARPTVTLLFADSAFADGGEGEASVIEYSFAEPRWTPGTGAGAMGSASGGGSGSRPDPSVHFRHGARQRLGAGAANTGWLDGHVSPFARTLWASSGLYPGDAGAAGTGWFGEADDNGLFCGR